MTDLAYPIPTNATNVSVAGAPPSNPSGEIVARLGSERIPVAVQFGPPWIAELLYAPPSWIGLALKLVVVAVAALVVLGYVRHGIDEDVLYEMSFAVFVVCGVLLLAEAVRAGYVPGPYVARMLVAGVGGWLLAHLFVRCIGQAVHRINNA